MSDVYTCENCHDTSTDVNGDACQECCDHDYCLEEGGMCLNCNADGYEDGFGLDEDAWDTER